MAAGLLSCSGSICCIALLVACSVVNLPGVSAFCVYNRAGSDVTFLAWPLGDSSFKKVVSPGDNECCNWADASCFEDAGSPEQCKIVQFIIVPKEISTSDFIGMQIIESLNLLKKDNAKPSLAKVVGEPGTAGSAIPSVGDTITAAAAFQDAGLSLSSGQQYFGMSLSADDIFVTAYMGGALVYNPTRVQATTPTNCPSSPPAPSLPATPTTLSPESSLSPPPASLIPPVPVATVAPPPTQFQIPPTPTTVPGIAPTALMMTHLLRGSKVELVKKPVVKKPVVKKQSG